MIDILARRRTTRESVAVERTASVAGGPTFQRILIVLGEGAAQRRVLELGLAVAEQFRSNVTLLTVVTESSPPWTFSGPFALPFTPESQREDDQRWAQADLDHWAAAVPDHIPFTRCPRPAMLRAGAAVVREIANGRYDLLVIGPSAGSSRSARVSRHVLRHSSVPVLTSPC